jgi:hypothetical protein
MSRKRNKDVKNLSRKVSKNMSRNIKRTMVLLICFTLIFCQSVFAADYSGHWSEKYITEAKAAGWMTGDANGNFLPREDIKRGDFTIVLWRVLGSPDPKAKCKFADVSASAYYLKAVTALNESGIVSGYGNGKFGPDDTLTREMAAVMFAKAFHLKAANNDAVKKFSDSANISSWALPYISALVEKGYLKGDGNKLSPKDTMLRGEMAALTVTVAKTENAPNTGAKIEDKSKTTAGSGITTNSGITTSSGTTTSNGGDSNNNTNNNITYMLTYTAGENGSITGNKTQIINKGASGTEVEAVPDTGYHFVCWSDGLIKAKRTDTSVTAAKYVTAFFSINTYALSYAAGANGSITGEKIQSVDKWGSGTEVEAVADAGYHFVKWSDDVTAAKRTDTGVTASISVTATFAPNLVPGITIEDTSDGVVIAKVTLTDTSIIIPSTIKGKTVVAIGPEAFKGNTKVITVSIPDTVKSIGEGAFAECTSLSAITIPNSVTAINELTFNSCIDLHSVTIGSGVTSIADYAFFECKKLNSLTIGDNVATIGQGAFWGCNNLSSVTIPASVTKIGDNAFRMGYTPAWALKNKTTWTSDMELALSSVLFKGNRPTLGLNVFANAKAGLVIKYTEGTTGWPEAAINGVVPVPAK